jgi:all-beta uncharacterized protein/BACON domain-containing protein
MVLVVLDAPALTRHFGGASRRGAGAARTVMLRRAVPALTLCLAAAWSAACGSSTQSVTSPSTVKCAVNAAANPASFPAAGGNGTLAVTTNRECQWSASASGGWIQLGSTSGQGEANVSFTVSSNADPATRRGSIAVGDQQIAISQEAAPCVFTVSPTRDNTIATGERKTVAVTASSPQCAWTARSDVDWLTIVSGGQGTGNGQVTYEAQATTGPARTGTLLVAGQVVTITQGEGCSSSIAPTAQSVAATGGTGAISVTTAPGCPWTAQSNAAWISITSGPTGTGPGAVAFTVGSWDGPARSGTLNIDGHVFTVSQAAGCSYTIDPGSQSIAAAGGSGAVNVHSATGCTWTAGSNASWLTITSGGTGSGDGRVQFTVAASTGPERSGTLTIAGRTFTVRQESGCAYSLVPSSQSVSDAAGSGSFAVNTTAGCAWSATSNAPSWLTITGSPSGSGNGTVTFQFSANAMGGPPRSGTISVNGETFTLNQAAGVPCVYTLTPTSQDVPAAGGSGSFGVGTVATCPWTAISNAAWIAIVGPPGGAGNGTVNFNVAANPTGSPPRSGTITVNGQTFTVNQAAGPTGMD